MAECTFCGEKIAFKTVYRDKRQKFPMKGTMRDGQVTITCLGCNRIMHTECVREHGTTIPGSHVLFADAAMRQFVAEERMAGDDIAFCLRCYDDVKDRIVRDYRDAGRDDEAAGFLAVLEGSEEDG
jgi:hypothetical protein